MSQYFDVKLDSTGDMSFDGPLLDTVEDIYAVMQRIWVRLNVHRGEWELNTEFGVPYRTTVLVKNPDFGAIQLALQTTIKGTPGVVGIREWTQSYTEASHLITASCQVDTDFGSLTVTLEQTPFISESSENRGVIWMLMIR